MKNYQRVNGTVQRLYVKIRRIHVLKEQSSMEDIRFTDPFRKEKFVVQRLGLGKKQRLVGSEVVETQFVEQQQHMGFLSHVWNWALSLVISCCSGNQ